MKRFNNGQLQLFWGWVGRCTKKILKKKVKNKKTNYQQCTQFPLARSLSLSFFSYIFQILYKMKVKY